MAAVLVDGYQRERIVVPLASEIVLGGRYDAIDVGAPAACARIALVDGAWLYEGPEGTRILVDGERWSLHGITLQFFATERSLADEAYLRTSIDGLTGAFNRRFLFAHVSRVALPASVLLIDIDHFMRFNDRNGHLRGDLALIAICERIRGELAWPEFVTRFGGEEFVVVLPGIADGAARAEQIRVAVEAPFVVEDEQVSMTVSIGVAPMMDDFSECFTVAESRLDTAKRNGRNRVQST